MDYGLRFVVGAWGADRGGTMSMFSFRRLVAVGISGVTALGVVTMGAGRAHADATSTALANAIAGKRRSGLPSFIFCTRSVDKLFILYEYSLAAAKERARRQQAIGLRVRRRKPGRTAEAR